MKLWTKELAEQTPKLYATEEVELDDKVVIAKFFALASSWTWYVVEASEEGDVIFFGYVDNDTGGSEWGYFALSELASLTYYGIPWIERDIYFAPTKFSDLIITATEA